MPSIYFTTPTELDINAVLVLGVSVKDTQEAIGRFGTGLKYAIAWLLRNSHVVRINGQLVETKPTEIRGRTFHLITIADQVAGFTTELGKDWEGWMAFRELYANTLDEGGEVGLRPTSGKCVIQVDCPDGSDFFDAYTERNDIILSEMDPLDSVGHVEVYARSSSYYYVRGVRAGKLPYPAKYTWNHKDPGNYLLTEDRLVKDHFGFRISCEELVMRTTNKKLITDVVLSGDNRFERTFVFTGCPGETFVEVVAELKSRPNINQHAISVIPPDAQSFKEVSLTDKHARLLEKACEVASEVCLIEPSEIRVTADFGYPTYGLYNSRTGEIWVSKDSFNLGLRELTATVLEEALHKHRNLSDNSRAMQDYLLNQLVGYLMLATENS